MEKKSTKALNKWQAITWIDIACIRPLGPLLLTWINFNLSMDL